MRQVLRAGEKLFVDFSGKRPSLVDATTGAVVVVELFVGVLGASGLIYAEATRRQDLAAWVSAAPALVRASSAASPAARYPTFDTTRETPQAWPRTPLGTCPARSGTHAACEAPRRHTMPSAPAVVKRRGDAGRTSVSQSLGPTGHSVRCTFAEGR